MSGKVLRGVLIRGLMLAGVLMGGPALADVYCNGTISGVIMYADGTVQINGSWRNDWTTLCESQADWGGIAMTTCLSWYAAALKASADGKSVTVWYPSSGSYACNNLPVYDNSLVPGYLRVTG